MLPFAASKRKAGGAGIPHSFVDRRRRPSWQPGLSFMQNLSSTFSLPPAATPKSQQYLKYHLTDGEPEESQFSAFVAVCFTINYIMVRGPPTLTLNGCCDNAVRPHHCMATTGFWLPWRTRVVRCSWYSPGQRPHVVCHRRVRRHEELAA